MRHNRWTTALALLFALGAGLSGMAGCYSTSCTDAAKAWCNTCEQNGPSQQDTCTCLEDGTLSINSSHLPFATDDDAAMWCDDYRNMLKYVGDDNAQECASEKSMLDEWGNDYCDYAGYWYF